MDEITVFLFCVFYRQNACSLPGSWNSIYGETYIKDNANNASCTAFDVIGVSYFARMLIEAEVACRATRLFILVIFYMVARLVGDIAGCKITEPEGRLK